MATRDSWTGRADRRSVPRRREGLDYRWDFPTGVAPSSARPRAGRNAIVLLSELNVLAGVWLVIAAWVLGYWRSDPRWNDIVCGIIVALLALTQTSGASHAAWLSWVSALIGARLLVAAFTIDASVAAGWNDAVAGVVVFLLAVGGAAATDKLRRSGAHRRRAVYGRVLTAGEADGYRRRRSSRP